MFQWVFIFPIRTAAVMLEFMGKRQVPKSLPGDRNSRASIKFSPHDKVSVGKLLKNSYKLRPSWQKDDECWENYRSVLRMEVAKQLSMSRYELSQGAAEIVAGINAPLNAVLRG